MKKPRGARIEIVMVLTMAALLMANVQPVQAGVVSLPVPRVTIYPGDLLTPDVLRLRRFKERATRGLPVVRLPDEVVGKVAKRTLLRGKLIALHALREPHVVQKGQQVRVVYVSGALTISTLATSLRSGSLGQLIQARNIDSGKIISGVVMENGTLRLGGR